MFALLLIAGGRLVSAETPSCIHFSGPAAASSASTEGDNAVTSLISVPAPGIGLGSVVVRGLSISHDAPQALRVGAAWQYSIQFGTCACSSCAVHVSGSWSGFMWCLQQARLLSMDCAWHDLHAPDLTVTIGSCMQLPHALFCVSGPTWPAGVSLVVAWCLAVGCMPGCQVLMSGF